MQIFKKYRCKRAAIVEALAKPPDFNHPRPHDKMASTSRQATVQDASPSPPPLPNEPLPTITDPALVVDQPIESLGDDDDESEDDDSDDEWDPALQRGPGEVKGKSKAKEDSKGETQPWQAVWAPEQNGEPRQVGMSNLISRQRGTSGTPRREKSHGSTRSIQKQRPPPRTPHRLLPNHPFRPALPHLLRARGIPTSDSRPISTPHSRTSSLPTKEEWHKPTKAPRKPCSTLVPVDSRRPITRTAWIISTSTIGQRG